MRPLIGLMLLAGCAASDAPPQDEPGFRDLSVPVASAALFDPQRFAGEWVVVADYLNGGACTDLTTLYRLAAPTVFAVTDRCAGPDFDVTHETQAQIVGPGRLQRSDSTPFVGQTEWVLWVDEGYRTAVLADPGGSFARILNREARIPADRLAAARDVLDFNGFDTGPLREVSQ